MARPLRIEFAGAWYHVMNRGAGRRIVYPNDALRQTFLDLLRDVHERHEFEVHAWCLMNNHYHLVCRTPRPNLGRCMRHIDGVYTQRHNRLCRTDGPLFRGRYKAILVEADEYLAQLTRYVHRNPVEANMVERAEHWQWSSYRNYLGETQQPQWLQTAVVLGLFGTPKVKRSYQTFVEQGNDDATTNFFTQARPSPILGSQSFCKKLESNLSAIGRAEFPELKRIRDRPDIETIIKATATAFRLDVHELVTSTRGRPNKPRAIAMSLCQSPGGHSLRTIAGAFGLCSYTAVSSAIYRLRAQRLSLEYFATIAELKKQLFGQA